MNYPGSATVIGLIGVGLAILPEEAYQLVVAGAMPR